MTTVAAPFPPIDGSQPCRQVDAELFFPEVGGGGERAWDTRLALDLCRSCDFLDACLAYALTHDVTGIWGATSHLARKQIRRANDIAAKAPATGLDDLLGVSA